MNNRTKIVLGVGLALCVIGIGMLVWVQALDYNTFYNGVPGKGTMESLHQRFVWMIQAILILATGIMILILYHVYVIRKLAQEHYILIDEISKYVNGREK